MNPLLKCTKRFAVLVVLTVVGLSIGSVFAVQELFREVPKKECTVTLEDSNKVLHMYSGEIN